MSLPEDRINISVEEYLSQEERSEVRHEFVDGRVFAMTGTSLRHNIIAGNLYSHLSAYLKGGPCRVFMSDVKVRVDATNSFYYPDILVSCTPTDTKSVYLKTPVLIAEVLSPSTAAVDRREKLFAYKQIPTLQEYLIAHQSKPQIEVMRRVAHGTWQSTILVENATIELTSMAGGVFRVEMSEIYHGVDWQESMQGGDDSEGWLLRESAFDESTWLSW